MFSSCFLELSAAKFQESGEGEKPTRLLPSPESDAIRIRLACDPAIDPDQLQIALCVNPENRQAVKLSTDPVDKLVDYSSRRSSAASDNPDGNRVRLNLGQSLHTSPPEPWPDCACAAGRAEPMRASAQKAGEPPGNACPVPAAKPYLRLASRTQGKQMMVNRIVLTVETSGFVP